MSSDNNFSGKLNDRILFIRSVDDDQWKKYFDSLKKKGYEIELAEPDELINISKSPVDIVVLSPDNTANFRQILGELRKLVLTPTTPCILLVPDASEEIDLFDSPNIHIIKMEEEISKFLVLVSIQLRLRKIRTEHVEAQVEVVSQNATLRDLNNRFQQDLKEAREIHEKLLPNSLPSFKHIRCSSVYLPLELVGGDIFDVWKVNDDSVGIFLGDITGHGLPAAFIASMTKMCFSLAPDKEPAEGLNFVNESLRGFLPDGRFITAVNSIIDIKNMSLIFANAGHPPPLHYSDARKCVDLLVERGMPLNIDSQIKYNPRNIQIDKGDKILFYSDGYFETVNMNNEVMGISKLKEKFLERCLEEDIDAVLNALMEYQREYSGGRMYRDDVTMIGIEIL